MRYGTAWRLVNPVARELQAETGVELLLVVNSQEASVVEAVEQAARENGVELELIEDG